MNACDNRLSLSKKNGEAVGTIRGVENWETSGKDFTDVVLKIINHLGCGNHHGCNNKRDCSISSKHKDGTRGTLALM